MKLYQKNINFIKYLHLFYLICIPTLLSFQNKNKREKWKKKEREKETYTFLFMRLNK